MENNSKKYANGSKWISNNSGEAEIIGKSDRIFKRKGRPDEKPYFLAKFEDGTIVEVMSKELRNGRFKNPNKKKDVGAVEEVETEESFEYLIKKYHKILKKNQKLTDELRITRRENRFDDRVENIVESFHSKLLQEIPKADISPISFLKNGNFNKEGVIQLSDVHAGEIVDDTYNLEIMKDRLSEIFKKAVEIFKLHNINKITLFLTGDMINANYSKHLDKMLMNEKTRAENLKTLFETLSCNIDGLLTKGFEVNIASIIGNESRINGMEHMSNVNEIAVNNFDYLLIVLLQARYNDKVLFLNDGNKLDDLITVNNKHFILFHGHQIKQSSEKIMYDEALRLKKKWYNKTNIMADYLLLGHIHSTLITSLFARSSALVGGNSYSEVGLNIPDSVASQNIFIVGNEILPIPIFLE